MSEDYRPMLPSVPLAGENRRVYFHQMGVNGHWRMDLALPKVQTTQSTEMDGSGRRTLHNRHQ